MKLRDFKKQMKLEAEKYVPNIIDKVKPTTNQLKSLQDHIEIIRPPKREYSLWNKRLAIQFASVILIITLSASIIFASLQPNEAVMSKEEFEEVVTEMVNVQISLWDYLPDVLSPKETSTPTSMLLLNPAGPPDFVNVPELEPNERIASRQLTHIQDMIQVLDVELTRMNEFQQNRSAIINKAKEEFGRGKGKANIAFMVNNSRVSVQIASKDELNLSAVLGFATYNLKYTIQDNKPNYQGSITYTTNQTISFEINETNQYIRYVGIANAKELKFSKLNEATVGELIEYTKQNGSFVVSNKGMILVDSSYTYVTTDIPLLEEQVSGEVYEIEVYDNDSGNFILSKIVLGELQIYRFDIDYLAGFDSVTYHQIGAGVNARQEFRVDGVRFDATSDYALVHRTLAIRQIGNARFGLTRYVLIPYLLVLKTYFDVEGLPTPFIEGDLSFTPILETVETLSQLYLSFIQDNTPFLNV